jgi:hypothetical protein
MLLCCAIARLPDIPLPIVASQFRASLCRYLVIFSSLAACLSRLVADLVFTYPLAYPPRSFFSLAYGFINLVIRTFAIFLSLRSRSLFFRLNLGISINLLSLVTADLIVPGPSFGTISSHRYWVIVLLDSLPYLFSRQLSNIVCCCPVALCKSPISYSH